MATGLQYMRAAAEHAGVATVSRSASLEAGFEKVRDLWRGIGRTQHDT